MMNIRFSRKQLCIPYALFLICFVILPLAVIVYYAFTDGSGRFTLENLLSFFTNGNTIGTLCYSLVIAAVVTAVCLLVAYPAAYVLARSGLKRGPVILMLFILPMWINFTLRITALKEILTVLEGNLSLHPFLNTVIGMTYDYLPFMILPLYTTLLQLDESLLEAASDLGAGPAAVFMRHAGHRERGHDDVSSGDDELRYPGYDVQQYLYHGFPDRKLFQYLRLEQRIHDLTDPVCGDLYHYIVYRKRGSE